MNKHIMPYTIVIFVILLIIFGYMTAPIKNESEIRLIYACDRLTKESRPTDKYCSSPESAPEAKKRIINSFSYAGMSIIIVGAGYAMISRKQKL